MRKFGWIFVFLVGLFLSEAGLSAQFKSEAFQQQYNSDSSTDAGKDSTDVMFSLKEYIGGLQHKNSLKIGTMFAGSTVFVGGCQIYNKQYWKLPVVYGAIGGSIGAGFYLKNKGNDNAAMWCFAGAGLSYWMSLMDGVVNYRPNDYPHAGSATLYSLLLPGLGQIYNHEYWKVPIYIGLMAFGVHYYSDCARNFQRFRSIYLEATDAEVAYTGPITADQALYYRNLYRRYRDYAMLAVAAVYLLQVIDANVFSYMHDFDVSDDIDLSLKPTVIMPDSFQFASNGGGSACGLAMSPAVGLKIGLNF